MYLYSLLAGGHKQLVQQLCNSSNYTNFQGCALLRLIVNCCKCHVPATNCSGLVLYALFFFHT